MRRQSRHADQGELGFSREEMTRVPPSDWVPPRGADLPDRLYGDVGLDLETNDHGLQAEAGPAWPWRGGHVAGYSVTADNFSGYLPVGHMGGGNVEDPNQVRRWLNHVLGDERQVKITANGMYDVGWAAADGVSVLGPVVDVQWVEALLDEHRREYTLDSIARDRIGERKDETLLREAAAAYGVHPKKELWKLPARYVGPYAEWDSSRPRKIWRVQEPLIDAEDLRRVFELEHALLPMYVDMRRRGVRVDVDYAEQLADELGREVAELEAEIKRRTGVAVGIWAAASIARAFDAEGIPYRRTAKTNAPSITKDLLERTDHWLPKLVLRAREQDKLAGTFIRGQVLGQLHDGRIYAQIHPLKSDDGGTVTGRLSMSDPNLQFIPTRTEEGKKVRRCFLPEEGDQWATLDFRQQEPGLLVHFATRLDLPGAAEACRRYWEDPSFSYHEFAAELTGLGYKPAKILNLAIIYGRGVPATAEQLQISTDECKEKFARHAEEMPFVRALSDKCQGVVRRRGYLRSLLGRRARFPLWEPADWDLRDGRMLPLADARAAWPNQRLVRARIHKSLNSLIQPSAADQTKAAMLAVWEAGLGHHVMIQVHDELDCSVPDRAVADQIAGVMAGATELEVPVRVDVDLGSNWRDASD